MKKIHLIEAIKCLARASGWQLRRSLNGNIFYAYELFD